MQLRPILNQGQAAKYLGITQGAVSLAIKRGGFPEKVSGEWLPADLDTWKTSRRTDGNHKPSTDAPEDQASARTRKLIADATRSELDAQIAATKLERIKGESIRRDVVDKLLRDIASRQKQVLMSLETEYNPKLRALHESQWNAEAKAFADRICTQMQRLVEGWKPTEDEE